jgi:hypothetical protein
MFCSLPSSYRALGFRVGGLRQLVLQVCFEICWALSRDVFPSARVIRKFVILVSIKNHDIIYQPISACIDTVSTTVHSTVEALCMHGNEACTRSVGVFPLRALDNIRSDIRVAACFETDTIECLGIPDCCNIASPFSKASYFEFV